METIFEYRQPKGPDGQKCNDDCMIRAVCNATDKPYSEVHQIMYKHGWRASRRNSKNGFEYQVTKTLDELGFKWERISFPAVKGQRRMTARQLAKDEPNARYVLRVSKHLAALSFGKLLDTWDCSTKCVYFAWRVSRK